MRLKIEKKEMANIRSSERGEFPEPCGAGNYSCFLISSLQTNSTTAKRHAKDHPAPVYLEA